MVYMTYNDVLAHEAKLKADKPAPDDAVTQESPLHRKIMDYCEEQWPKWKYIRARMDKRSTIAVGAQDITIFASRGRLFCIECKSKSGKLDPDQLIWRKEMEMVGHPVHLVRSFSEFLELVK
jgi:hypothetical protein